MTSFITKLSIIIPVYLGENTIELLCYRLCKVLQNITHQYEILLVNDASPDGSWEKIETLCKTNKQIKGINLSRNFGQHAAISAGLKYAFGKKVVIMDCDLQDVPEDLIKLWGKSQEGYDIVMARRTQRKDKLWKRFFSWSFHQILSLKRGKRTDPAIANYAIYDRKIIEEYYANHENKAFSILNIKNEYSFITVDVKDHISGRGKSSYTLSKQISLALNLLFPGKNKDITKSLYVIEKTVNVAIENYDVRLLPLTGEKIEMVRQWRNDPKISQYMEYQEYITPDMQKKWFESINNLNNYYFVIDFEGKEIGLINTKNIDYSGKTSEGGLFIYDDRYLNSDISLRVSLCLLDFGVKILNIEEGIIHILKTNKKAIEFNKILGYTLEPNQENIENQLYKIRKENYFRQREYLINLL